ncbi:hypothetical protein NQ314_005203 [Rhamnusium bicolor]|uniref:YqaJ viral recombinase domain-containing protein n=1 Tax=Rhamnusium bicolor TaxID=1586634 RepID=A0AAV8ZH31_9CUCU|nr:hypothetical protein NQ314_005203 [Rhamnusium bicolor]
MQQGYQKADSHKLPHVNVQMVFDFLASNANLNHSQSSGVKGIRSGREDYGDSAVGYVQVRRDGNVCTVRGRICPEHKVKAKPYSVTFILNEKESVIQEINCMDCAASAGGFKHSIAFLMWLHRRSEEPAPTTVACYWKKPILAQVGSTIKFIKAEALGKPLKKPSIQIPTTTTFLEEVLQMSKKHDYICPFFNHSTLPSGARKLAIHQMIIDFIASDYDQTAESFISFCSGNLTQKNIENANSLSHTQSENALWFELRYGRITASKLYEASVSMNRGIRLEKAVLKELEKDINTRIDVSGFIILQKFGILGASPDGVTKDSVVEIKCSVSEQNFSRYIDSNGEISKKYLAQVNLQMLSKNLKKGIFCVAHPDFETSK